MEIEERIEKKIDLLFRLCFKNADNYTFGSFFWDEIKECIPLFGISAKKVDIKDFPTQEEIQIYIDKIDNLIDEQKKEFKIYAEKNRNEERKLKTPEFRPYPIKEITALQEQYYDKRDEYNKKIDELRDISDTIEELTDNWFRNTYFGEFNTSNCVLIKGLKDSIESNYRAQFVNDLLKKLGIKRIEYDYSEYIGEVIKANKQLKEIFKRIDKMELNN